MSAHVDPNEHDVFLLKAVVDGVAVFGVQLSRSRTLTACEIQLPGGERVCFAEREGIDDDIRFYTDASKATELLRVTARRRQLRGGGLRRTLSTALRAIAAGRTYDVSAADGPAIGAIHKVVGERQYHVSDTRPDSEPMIVIQEPEAGSLKQWAQSSRPLSNDRFAFWRGERRLGTHEPHPGRTDSTLDLTLDGERTVDRRLALAVSCLDLLRVRNED